MEKNHSSKEKEEKREELVPRFVMNCAKEFLQTLKPAMIYIAN